MARRAGMEAERIVVGPLFDQVDSDDEDVSYQDKWYQGSRNGVECFGAPPRHIDTPDIYSQETKADGLGGDQVVRERAQLAW